MHLKNRNIKIDIEVISSQYSEKIFKDMMDVFFECKMLRGVSFDIDNVFETFPNMLSKKLTKIYPIVFTVSDKEKLLLRDVRLLKK